MGSPRGEVGEVARSVTRWRGRAASWRACVHVASWVRDERGTRRPRYVMFLVRIGDYNNQAILAECWPNGNEKNFNCRR